MTTLFLAFYMMQSGNILKIECVDDVCYMSTQVKPLDHCEELHLQAQSHDHDKPVCRDGVYYFGGSSFSAEGWEG
jgi:hypothetical protein